MASRQCRFVALIPVVVGLLGLTGFLRSEVFGQQTGPQNPQLVIKSVAGRDLFEFYCATCHGRDAKGAGPAAKVLRVEPPNLTLLASRTGVFPSARVEAVVAGEEMPPAHGSPEMPVWGPIFRGLDPNDGLNRVRIRNIVDYLASIQTK